METGKKSDAEINEILNELRDLELYDNDEYKKKLAKLKKSDASTYFKIMIMLNLNTEISYSSTDVSQNLLIIPKTPMPIIQTPTPKTMPKTQEIANPEIKPVLIPKTQEIAAPEIKPILTNIQKTPMQIIQTPPPKLVLKTQIPNIQTPPQKIIPKPQVTKKIAEKKSNPAAFSILSMAVIGILLLSAMGFFWIMNPPTGDTSRNSLRLGYQIFNSLNDTYLNYTFLYNSSDLEFLGKQYYYLDDSKITAVIQYPQRDIVSKRQDDYLYYDISGNYSKISTSSLRINNALITSLYDEVYNLVNNYYTNESGREGVWNLTNIPCAPIFFDIDVNNDEFSDLIRLRYEMCLDNNGIPVAIAKESIYQDSYEVIIAYLESMSPEIRDLSFANKTMAYWEALVIDDY